LDLKIARSGGESGKEDSVERSLGDSLFADLEADLEALGLLQDVSEALIDADSWTRIDELAKPGRMLRVTAPGALFHPAQMSEALVGLATAAIGLDNLDVGAELSTPVVPPKAKTDAQKKAERAARQNAAMEPRFPEDFLPPVEVVPLMGLPRAHLAGMIRVVRGVFGEGVHLHLRPMGDDGPVISARLEPGRRFFDSSPEVLFSRYGLAAQQWTAVGIVGQLGGEVPSEADDVTNADGSVNRAKVVDLVGRFLGSASGLVDLPQDPGFSLVPLAVYRSIGESITTE